MKDGQTRKVCYPSVKGLQTKRTKFGHRWILTEKGRDGKPHSITVPIEEGDSVETFRKKVDDARRRLERREADTFDAFVRRFFEQRMLSASTRQLYGYALRGFSFNEAENARAMERLLARRAKRTTIAEYVSKVNCFFRWAVEHGSGVANPARGVRVKHAASARQRIITDSELGRIMEYAAAREPGYRLFILLLIHTGARVSSVMAIRGKDMTEHGLRLYNVKCRRFYEYSIPVRNREILDAMKQAGEGRIFGHEASTYHKRLNSWLCRTFRQDERGERLSVHSFRHSFASRAAQNDVPLEVVSKLLDHQSVATTAKFYARFSHEQIADAVDKALHGI